MDPQTASSTLSALLLAPSISTSTTPEPKAEIKITPFQRQVYILLLQIPPGSFTTYSLLSASLPGSSSPRAVGNACRSNPFAPTVPCHRVVATDKSLGGFKGEHLRKIDKNRKDKGEKNKKALLTLDEKRTLLRKEGVRFDSKGEKVLGTPFRGFKVT